jgi:prepilin-type N-terminal cleavage/methylation domain-containing protein
MRARRAPLGVTLIELMVTVAIASVIVSAAVAVFISMSRQLRRSERRLEASNAALLASTIIQGDLTNTGYRFPNPAFAVRHYNNVDGTTSLSGPTPVTITGGCGSPTVGLVEGTDVLQVAQGFEFIGPGRARSVTGGPDFEVVLDTLGEPFESTEFGGAGVGSIMLMSGANQRGCMARVTALNASIPSMTVRLVNRDLTDAPAGGYHPSCPSPGGLEGTRVYRLQRFVRYMVCGPIGRGPEERSLFRQESTRLGVFQAPQVVQGGVEDLQVSVGYSDPNNVIGPTGSGASCTGAGIARVCFCDDLPTGATCSIPAAHLEPTLGSATRAYDTVLDPALGVMVSRARGVRLIVTGISTRRAGEGDVLGEAAELRRPASMDHAAETLANRDGFWRSQQFSFMYFHNFGVAP